VPKPNIQTIGALKDILKQGGISDQTPIFFYYQSPEEAGLKSKSFEWKCTGICIETDDQTGFMRIGFFSDLDPEVATVTENKENLQ
jgi:hypothetical protein